MTGPRRYKLIRARYVLPFASARRDQVIEDGYVLTDGERIAETGSYSAARAQALVRQYGPDLELPWPGKNPADPVARREAVLMPSPKFGHTHFHESVLTGRFKNHNLLSWLDLSVNPHTYWLYGHDRFAQKLGKNPYEVVFAKTLHDVLRSGSGFVAVHNCNFTKYDAAVDALAELLERSRARAIIFPGSQDKWYEPEFLLDHDPAAAAARVRAQMQRHADKRWVRVMPGADQLFSNSPRLLSALKSVARESELELGQPVYFHVHSSEHEGATRRVYEATGMTEVEYAQQAGILDERTIVAHQVQTTAADLDILRDRGVKVVSNPTANGSLMSGIAPVAAMLRRGIPVAYSTDGSGSSDHQDIFTVMHVGLNMNRGSEREEAMVITDQKALEMILVEPALMYGLNADSLEPGKDASLVLYAVDFETNPWMVPHSADSLVGKLVFCNPSGRNVTDSLSLGEWIVRNGRVVTMDGDAIARDVQELDDLYWREAYPRIQKHRGTGGDH